MNSAATSPHGKDLVVCSVNLPDERSPPEVTAKKTDSGLDLLYKVFDVVDIVERDYFGVTFKDHNSCRRWLEPSKTLSHQFKKLRGIIPLTLQVKFYPNDPLHLKNEFSRYLLYRQVRKDIHENRTFVPDSSVARLLGFLLQAEFSDWSKDLPDNYPDDVKLKAEPLSAMLKEQAIQIHKTLAGLTAKEMEVQFIQEVTNYTSYGLDVYMCKDQEDQQLMVGLGCNGIYTFAFNKLTHEFKWREILKMYCDGKQFFAIVRLRESQNGGCLKYLSSSDDDEVEPFSDNSVQLSDTHKHLCAFRCSSVTQAKVMWKSAMERKTFFTAASSGENNKNEKRSALTLYIKRSQTFNFVGRVQREVMKDDVAHDPTFVRYTWASNTLPRMGRQHHTPVQSAPLLTPSHSPSARKSSATLGCSPASDTTLSGSTIEATATQIGQSDNSINGAQQKQPQQQQQQQQQNSDLYNTPPASPELNLVEQHQQQQSLVQHSPLGSGGLTSLIEESEETNNAHSVVSLCSNFAGQQSDAADYKTVVGESGEEPEDLHAENRSEVSLKDDSHSDRSQCGGEDGVCAGATTTTTTTTTITTQRTYSVKDEDFHGGKQIEKQQQQQKQDFISTAALSNNISSNHRSELEDDATVLLANGSSVGNRLGTAAASSAASRNNHRHDNNNNNNVVTRQGILLRLLVGLCALLFLIVATFEMRSPKLDRFAPFLVHMRHAYYEPAKLAIVPRLQKLMGRR